MKAPTLIPYGQHLYSREIVEALEERQGMRKETPQTVRVRAILRDMSHPLSQNERFIRAFAVRLARMEQL